MRPHHSSRVIVLTQRRRLAGCLIAAFAFAFIGSGATAIAEPADRAPTVPAVSAAAAASAASTSATVALTALDCPKTQRTGGASRASGRGTVLPDTGGGRSGWGLLVAGVLMAGGLLLRVAAGWRRRREVEQ